jgi:hypothetical protein
MKMSASSPVTIFSITHVGEASETTNPVEPDTAGVSRIDALTHEFDNPRKFVGLYALVGKLRLFAAANVVSRVEEVMRRIAETYNLPNRDFRNPEGRQEHDVDVLRALSEAC